MLKLLGQPVTVVAVAVACGVGASGGVVDAHGEGGGSVGDGEGAIGECGGRVVLPVASMVRVLSPAVGGVTYQGRMWRWW